MKRSWMQPVDFWSPYRIVLHLFQEPQDYADWVIDQIDPDRSET